MKETTLLLVDDEPAFLDGLAAALEDDFHVIKTLNGFEAIKIIDSTDLSLIILDLRMPGMDGVKLLKKIRSSHNDIPVIVLSGSSTLAWAIKCADLNVQGYMEKPVDISRLIMKIRKLLKIEEPKMLKDILGDNYKQKISSYSPKIRKTIKYLQENYKKDLKRDEIATYINVTPEYLSRLFHKECGFHLKDFVNMLRVSKCKEHLLDLNKNVGDIAILVGIMDIGYLSRLFKKYTGLTPLEFRKKAYIP